MTGPVERYHRRPANLKRLDPPPAKPCASPWCDTGWERLPGLPYCSHCHMRIEQRADLLRERTHRKAQR